MPESDFAKQIQKIIDTLTKKQSEIITKKIAVAFTLGSRKSGTAEPLSRLQKEAIKKLSAESLGYIQEYNQALSRQLTTHLQDTLANGGGYDDAKQTMIPYIREVFNGGEVTIDRTGQTRMIVEVGQDGSLTRVKKTITRPYSASIETYSDLLSRTVAHTAFEKGELQDTRNRELRNTVMFP